MIESSLVVSLPSLPSTAEKRSNFVGLPMELAIGCSEVFMDGDAVKANASLHCTATKRLASVILDRFLMVSSGRERMLVNCYGPTAAATKEIVKTQTAKVQVPAAAALME
jgi:hypothetical protein